MRVLHVIPSLSPKSGGPSEALFPMVRSLRSAGITVEIATTDEDAQLLEKNGLPILFFKTSPSPFSFMRKFGYAPHFRRWLSEHLDNHDIVHVHAIFSYLSTVAMQVCRHHGKPYLTRPLGQLGIWPLRQSAFRKRHYLRWIEGANLRGAATLHFTSEMERRETAPLGLNSRAAVIPHGAHIPEIMKDAEVRLRRYLQLPERQKIILFLGRLHAKKGIDLLLLALATLNDPTVSLVMAGEGPMRPAVEKLIRHHHLKSQVILTGFVTGETKQLFLQGCDVFALTSHHENFGVAVMEALAANRPVLISEHVALADEVRHHQLGEVVPLEVPAIALALRKILEDEVRGTDPYRRFVAERYSWNANAKSLIELYGSILSENTP